MGHSNPFVTGEVKWEPGFKPRAAGLSSVPQVVASSSYRASSKPVAVVPAAYTPNTSPIIGNKNSGIYHLPKGCPSYDKVAQHNRVVMATEQEAISRGFRKAGNCK